MADRVTTKNKGMVSELPLTISAQDGLISQDEFFNKKVASKDLSSYLLLHHGDFAYNKSYSNGYPFGTIKRLEKYPQGVVSSLYIAFKPNSSISSDFMAQYYESNNWHKEIYKCAAEGARNHGLLNIPPSDFFATNLNIPITKSEQLKIGRLLNAVDHTFTLHEEKKRQLERLKSALLQKMFADKSGYPAVRFKGFDDIWDQEKLNSLVRLHRGLTYSPNNVQDSGIRILRSSNILDGQFVMTDDDIFVKSSVVNIPTVKDGDILITAANGSIKLVGKHAIISGISENTAVSGGFMLVGSSRIPDFVNSLFDTSWYQRFIRKYVTGGNGSIGNLKKNDLDKQYVKVPTTSEQERIGEFFREIDQLIINNQIKHEKLLELKKFLLQNMFI
ncbi:restriction endonuclease subunit S [Lactobacillus delbrueckii]|uniref:restriction endonuclease subunit S n=1 Tax=Lactobacillus delbrueckii TaxID=1584 RepID=UPI001E60C510|nr:restriction endonuclease subunit S [Lactobacillus delbrueckii subsp. lactis]